MTRESFDLPSREDIMFKRGERDGLAGLNMSSTSKEYHEGWIQGRRAYLENKEWYGNENINMPPRC